MMSTCMLDISNDIADTINAAVCLGQDRQHIYVLYVDVIFVSRNAQRFYTKQSGNVSILMVWNCIFVNLNGTS